MKNRETTPEKWDTAKFSPYSDYVIEETPDGKIVKNEKLGLSFKIPTDWSPKETPSFLPDISFYRNGTEVNQDRSDVLNKGCRINMAVAYIKTNIDVLEKEIRKKEIFNQPSVINEYRKREIKNQPAIEHVFKIEDLKMYFNIIYIPVNNKLYEISLNVASQDREQCQTEFNKFLETISIKK